MTFPFSGHSFGKLWQALGLVWLVVSWTAKLTCTQFRPHWHKARALGLASYCFQATLGSRWGTHSCEGSTYPMQSCCREEMVT